MCASLFSIDIACSTGWPRQNRGRNDGPGWTMVSPVKKFSCDGQVIEWQYYSKASSPFKAIVWRPIEDSDTQFQIVGVNIIPAGALNTEVTYTVPDNELITVKSGDLIGWSHEGVVPFNTGGGTRVRFVGGHLYANLVVGLVQTINQGVEDREYSIAATVRTAGKYLLYHFLLKTLNAISKFLLFKFQ